MIPAPNTLTQIDTLPGDEIEFGIGDPRWVMRTQADLYSDVTTAIIREYSTNAYDAHVMANNPDPIEVTLPSVMNPFFVVTDKGVGMNREIFKKIYTQFGVSDKRETNDVNGMLGYGSKSGVAYTNQLVVTSVRDGIKTKAVIQRRPDWSIVLKIIAEHLTDEPNGTEIRIPVHNIDEFNHKAREFYKFWLPGRVIVNDKVPVHAVGRKIADNLYYSQEWSTSYVVMGNVAYRIANPDILFRETKMNKVNFVAYVDKFETEDGSAAVEFTPSREDLKYTDRTKATLQAVINKFETDILAAAKDEIISAADHAEAYLAWSKWVGTLGRDMFADLEFKGEKFRSDFKIRAQRYQKNQSRYAVHSINQWSVESMPKTMIVTEFDLNMSSDIKAKAREFVSLKGWNDVTYILFTAQNADEIDSPWIKRDKFVTWEDLKAALPKKPRKPHGGGGNNPNAGRVSGSWDYFTAAGTQREQPLPKDAESIFYIDVQQEKAFVVSSILARINDTKSVVLLVPANRLPKLLREHPEVKPFIPYARSKVVTDSSSLLSDDAKEVLSLDSTCLRWLSNMDLTKVKDPEVIRLCQLVKSKDALTKRYEDNLLLARSLKMWYDVKEYRADGKNLLVKKYPLLDRLSAFKMHEHIYIYLNAVHAAETEKKND